MQGECSFNSNNTVLWEKTFYRGLCKREINNTSLWINKGFVRQGSWNLALPQQVVIFLIYTETMINTMYIYIIQTAWLASYGIITISQTLSLYLSFDIYIWYDIRHIQIQHKFALVGVAFYPYKSIIRDATMNWPGHCLHPRPQRCYIYVRFSEYCISNLLVQLPYCILKSSSVHQQHVWTR